jgi:hypothetical protein
MDLSCAHRLLRSQDGVISRSQALECGLDDNGLEGLLRRRELARIHPGIYVDHTGPATWSQRAWAATLFHWPAALAGPSALRAHGLRSFTGGGRADAWTDKGIRFGRVAAVEPVHVVVDASRRVVPPSGVVVTRRSDFESRVLSDACQEGATTASRLRATLAARGRLPRRRLLLAILDDVANGTMSVLERRYLSEVERAHGLPTARRQVRAVTRWGVTYRDVEYPELGVVVELDGRFVHAGPAREWADLERDVDAANRGDATLRLGWSHVLEPCRASLLVGRLLRSRGWDGELTSCGPSCGVARSRHRVA